MSSIEESIYSDDIDINNSELFFSNCIKGFIYYMINSVKIRGMQVPHFIISTGDDIMYKELLNYSYNNCAEVTGEDFIYTSIPRCIVDMSGLSIPTDKLTQPYVRGHFELEYEDNIREFSAELSRTPIVLNVNTKYYLDTFTDSLSLIQYIVSHLAFVRKYHINYLGQTIGCSIKLPDSYDIEKQIEVDFNSDSRYRTVDVNFEIETNMPVYNNLSAVETSKIITKDSYSVKLDTTNISPN